MTVAHLAVRERPARAREHLIASRLRRFAWRHREAVAVLTRRHPRLADLALSFPALLFALAVPRRRFDAEPVIERTIMGAPLRELAEAAMLPLWTRRLIPEAFFGPLPPLPDGELFRRQIANHWPASPKTARTWLVAVATAALWGHEDLAIWYARQVNESGRSSRSRNWRLICLWAWHCRNGASPASQLIETPWSPGLSPAEAAKAARRWLENIRTGLTFGHDRIEDPWGEVAEVDGFHFEPIRTASGLIQHANELENCARGRARSIAVNQERLWIVRQEGKTVAMLSLGAWSNNPYPVIHQLRGPRNEAASSDVWCAANRWFRAHVPIREVATRSSLLAPAEWRKYWRSYWLSKGSIPAWLPLRVTWCVLRTLQQDDAEWPSP